ncbi:MAG: rod shape-determining protein MreD [Acidaminococcaceae bacterium]|jgi:rod shape-determining protein MreD|nr:rod shape-determining protein MreD [Acidaminococcaceae bacterium]
MTQALWPLLALLLFAVQIHWFMFFSSTQAPDLLLLFLLLFSLDTGGRRGARCGFFIGTLQDVVTFSFFGYHMITRLLLGFLIGSSRERIFKDKIATFFVLVAVVSIFLKIVTAIFLMLYRGHMFPWGPILSGTLKYMGWNLLCSVPMWIIFRILRDYIGRRENPYYHF